MTPNDLYLDESDWQGWQSEKLEHSINGLVDHIEIVQALFAKAEKAHDDKDDKLERAYLDQIIQMYMWSTEHFREVDHLLDRRYVNEYLDKMENEIRSSMANNSN